jgi:hypothetical protein
MLDRLRDLGDAGVGSLAKDFFPGGIHRKYSPGVSMLAEVALRTRSVLGGIARSTNQGHRSRGEKRLREAHAMCNSGSKPEFVSRHGRTEFGL